MDELSAVMEGALRIDNRRHDGAFDWVKECVQIFTTLPLRRHASLVVDEMLAEEEIMEKNIMT